MVLTEENRCGSWGVGMFISRDLLTEWLLEVLDKSIDGILLVLMTNKKTDFTIMLVSCYLPPEQSNWGSDSDMFNNHFSSMLYMHEDNVDLFIAGGDFNGRLGNRDDFILDVDNILKRKNIDDVLNKHGEALLEFLIGNKLCVLNGRLPGDDNFTIL